MRLIRKLKYPLTIIIFVIILLYIIYLMISLRQQKYDNISSQEIEFITDNQEELGDSQENICYVDIKGAIKQPNVYQVSCDYTVNDVIKVAGGITDEADTSVINLAKQVSNEMVIIVYTKEEVKNSNIVDTVIKTVESECVCPNIQNDGCINNEITGTIGGDSLININKATLQQLQELTGIGESKAKAIIKYREEVGSFKSIEDLLNVDGIGATLYEQIKAYITT